MNYNRTEEARRNRMSAMVDDEGPEVVAAKGADQYEGRKQLRDACSIRLDRIIPDPDQPRKEFDAGALERLAESLKTRGQLQPIRVRWDEGRGAYVVVVGERRWRAAGMAGMETVSCVVISGAPTAAEILEDQLVENCLREDLKPIEAARSFRTLMDGLRLTQQQLAAKLQISQTTVSQSLSLLDLPAPVQSRVDAGDLAPSAAYLIAKVANPEILADLADRVVAERFSRAETVEAVRKVSARKAKGRGATKARKVTSRVFRKQAGYTVTIENGRGIEPGGLIEALELVLATVRAELAEGDQVAA